MDPSFQLVSTSSPFDQGLKLGSTQSVNQIAVADANLYPSNSFDLLAHDWSKRVT